MNTAVAENKSVLLDLPVAVYEKLQKLASSENINLATFVTRSKAPKYKYPVSDDVPNEETAAVLRDVMAGKNLVTVKATTAKKIIEELLEE